MVNQSAASLLAEFADAEYGIEPSPTDRTAARFATTRREQPSRARFATQARYSRRRSLNADTPRGPRRRQRQPNGL